MKTTLESNNLTIYLQGRIDSNNAITMEQEIISAVRNASGANIVLDVYMPINKSHVHGHIEPLNRKNRATFPMAEPSGKIR